MMRTRWGWMLAFAGAVALTRPAEVDACGGCFAPPQTVQVVTDHRMVLSLSSTQTTLWDQFQYTGRPQDFSWILPIRYTDRTRVELASNDFMVAADALTAPQIQPPTRPFPSCGFGAGGGAPTSDSGSASDAGVSVLREEVVGPYAVAIIRGMDPMAIRNWLTMNGYAVPPAVVPVIDFYTAMNMDYIALRLRPGEGIDRMTPVRVTLQGYVPRLPLRMIAAGVADKVGLSLVVLSEGRIEAENFPNGEVTSDDLTWDWNTSNNPSRDFLNAFERRNNAAGGRLWLTESSFRHARSTWESQARFGGGFPGGPGFPRDAGASDGGDAGAPPDPVDDVRVAFESIGSTAVATRMRADLLGRLLDRDLSLAASTRGDRARLYTYGRQLNIPAPPVCPDSGIPVIPQGDASAFVDAGGGGGNGDVDAGAPMVNPVPSHAAGGIQCAVQRPGDTGGSGFGLIAGLASLATAATLVSRARRKR